MRTEPQHWLTIVRSRPESRWSWRLLLALVFVAVFADFLANDKPLLAGYQGTFYVPVVREYAVQAGWSRWPADLANRKWSELELDWAVWPPIPYGARTIDLANSNYRSPFADQRVRSWRWRHWLGTDRIGRDVAAGLIAGTRIALAVGLIAMSLALLLGLAFGSLAGYFGDNGLRVRRATLPGALLGLAAGIFYGFVAGGEWESSLLHACFGLTVMVALTVAMGWLSRRILRTTWWQRRTGVPLDLLVMRLIEAINSIPALLLLLAVLALIRRPTVFYVMAIIGLLRWTGIARFVRAELLRIRRLDYIDAARVLGYSEWRILLRHALPNAIGPVLISLSFGIAGAILLEAFLSFLGIGLPPDVVTWGQMLREARINFSAWWLAVFPGLAIFLTVTAFNLLGDTLSRR